MKALLILLAVTLAARADHIIPVPFDKARYAETIGKSPFVLETKMPGKEQPPNPPVNLYLRGITKVDGKDYVLLQRPGDERSIRLIGNDPGEDHLAVRSVTVGNKFRETKVEIQQGMETSEVSFKEDTLAAQPAAPHGKISGGLVSPITKPGLPTVAPQVPGVPRQRVRVINN